MRCLLLIDDAAPRLWHARLAAALGAEHACAIKRVRAEGKPLRPPALDLLLLLDRTLHGDAPHFLDEVDVPATVADGVEAELVINLTSAPHNQPSGRQVVPEFNGVTGEAGLWAALLEGHAPTLALRDTATGHIIPIGRPALETPHRLRASADAVLARLIEGIVRAMRLGLGTMPDSTDVDQSPRTWATASFAYANRTLQGKALRVLQRRLRSAPQWAVAWRAAPAGRPWPAAPVSLADWNLLADDGQRYYADPFAVRHEGRRHVFVEELPYATGRGIISAYEIDADGRASAPRPVLETPFHLSYPQVFEEDGAIYMLPEAAASGRLTLYRAERIPDRWVAVAELLHEPVHDATLVKHEGLYWLFAGTETAHSSTWDALSLFSAPSLLGPWQAHPANPVLLDVASARPAGAMFSRDGRLWRPAQDCQPDYGAALTLARIDRLDTGGYAQSAAIHWQASTASGLLGPHTWNCEAGLELVDLYGPRRKLRP